jgi:hypothetical protein
LKPNRLDLNPITQTNFDMKTFYRSEFKRVLDTLITLSTEYLKKCMTTIEPLFKVFSTPLQPNYIADNFKKIIELFPPGSSASQLTDYNRIFSEFLILVHHCKGMSNLLEILKTSESFKH